VLILVDYWKNIKVLMFWQSAKCKKVHAAYYKILLLLIASILILKEKAYKATYNKKFDKASTVKIGMRPLPSLSQIIAKMFS